MEWINDYQLVLLDFDGLLVNTEKIHYRAYQKMCAMHGCDLAIDFPAYCSYAHYSSDGLRHTIYEMFPHLVQEFPDWQVLYKEKSRIYNQLLRNEPIELMPGADVFLRALEKANVKRSVVTHSAKPLVDILRNKIDGLKTIPYWITREDYNKPKPHTDCYAIAIKRYAKEGDQVVGFEDTPRGMQSLMPTGSQGVIIASITYPEIEGFKKEGAFHYTSLENLPRVGHLG